MSLGQNLAIVLVAFVAILVAVITMAFRERRLGKSPDASSPEAQKASDARVITVIFTAIPGGMLLTAIAAWLVFL